MSCSTKLFLFATAVLTAQWQHPSWEGFAIWNFISA